MKLGSLEFKADDFLGYPIEGKQKLADIVNSILAERLEKSPPLFSLGEDRLFWSSKKYDYDTHTARLVCVEELEKTEKKCSPKES
jgi:hypothetical protein